MVNEDFKPAERFWKNISLILDARGRSARSLALEVGVSPATFTKYSRGSTPSLNVAAAISSALKVSLDQLVFMPPVEFSQAMDSELRDSDSNLTLRSIERQAALRLVDELDLGRLAHMATASLVKLEVSLLEMLSRQHPAALTEAEIAEMLGHNLDTPGTLELASALASLKAKELIQACDGSVVRFQSIGPNVQLKMNDAHNREAFVLEALYGLMHDVFPTLQRHPRHAKLLTSRLRIRKERFQEFASRLFRATTGLWQEFDTRQGGDDVFVLSTFAMPEPADR